MQVLSNYRMVRVFRRRLKILGRDAARRMSLQVALTACIVTCASLAGFSQQPSSPATSKQPATQQKQPSTQGDIGIQVQPADAPAEKKITPAEAQQLFASIDETLSWLSKDTGYAIKQQVKGELASREQVAKYVDEKMNENEDAKRLERSEIVLKKFGLLPRDFDLHKFLVQLLQEQVAGYYDVKTKKMYLLDWLSADAQKPVLAHELTHALQDQNFDLKTWESPKAAKGRDQEEFSFDEDEASTARSAVAEGQGMVTLVDYMLRDSGRTLAEAPQVAEMMRKAMTSNSEFPLLQKAPLMIRESLVFPYGDGLTFEASLLQKDKETAFSGAFRRPPQDTHQILDVAAYLHDRPVQWLVLPDLRKELGTRYEKYDVGSIGQLDTRILVEQYGGKDSAVKMADAWRGGAYYAASIKDSSVTGTAKVGLLYLSRWDSAEAANEFAEIYSGYVPDRYTKALRLNAAEAADKFCGKSECGGSYFFQTEEGWVTVQRVGNESVLVTEGFDPETAKKIEQKVLTANPETSIRVAVHSLMSPLRTSAIIREMFGGIIAKRLTDDLRNSAAQSLN
jgi:hypothetical protein